MASAASVGAIFRTARETLGLSQHRVSDLTEERGTPVSRSAICDIERGTNMPGIESLVALCEVLRIDPLDILEQVGLSRRAEVDLMKMSADQLQQKGLQLFRVGQYRASSDYFAAVAERVGLERSGDPAERRRRQARSDFGRAAALVRFGEFRRAEAAAKRAIHLAPTGELAVGALLVLAGLHTSEGLLPLAAAESECALERARMADSPRLLAMALCAKASALYQSAQLEEAIEFFVRARDVAIQAGDPISQARYEGNIGTWHSDRSHPAAARRQFEKAVVLARDNHAPAFEAYWQIEIGVLALQCENVDEAERRAAAALRLARVTDNPLTLFRGIWLQHRIVTHRDPRDPDRLRVGHLKRLFPRVAGQNGNETVREFRREILRAKEA